MTQPPRPRGDLGFFSLIFSSQNSVFTSVSDSQPAEHVGARPTRGTRATPRRLSASVGPKAPPPAPPPCRGGGRIGGLPPSSSFARTLPNPGLRRRREPTRPRGTRAPCHRQSHPAAAARKSTGLESSRIHPGFTQQSFSLLSLSLSAYYFFFFYFPKGEKQSKASALGRRLVANCVLRSGCQKSRVRAAANRI